MIVATWNINGVRARSQRLAEWLEARKPDVVCMQELKIQEAEFPMLELRAAGYHAVVSGQQSWNGVAVVSREPVELVTRGLVGAEDLGARFVVARTMGIEVASAYIPNGKTVMHEDFQKKLVFLDRLARYVEGRKASDVPFVVAGDFNVCPTPLDTYGGPRHDGRIFCTKEERALIARLPEAGLVDLFRAKHADLNGFSWWDYRAGSFHKNEGLRIDMLFATPGLAARVKDVYVDRDYRKKGPTGAVPSDHAPVIAELEG